MPEIVNMDLLRHPVNWITVTLMVLIAGIGMHFILDFHCAQPNNQQ